MKPDPPMVLRGIGQTLATRVLPELRTPFGFQTVGLAAGILNMVAQEYDRAAARLVEENDVLRQLFSDAVEVVEDSNLRARLRGAADESPARDYRVSTLQAENDALRALLIELHAAVERQTGGTARELNERIWDELLESTRRRHVQSGLAG
ncbi:MAG: hypothetical protein Kow0010_12820 [Dehalococcoidia bacterium]